MVTGSGQLNEDLLRGDSFQRIPLAIRDNIIHACSLICYEESRNYLINTAK